MTHRAHCTTQIITSSPRCLSGLTPHPGSWPHHACKEAVGKRRGQLGTGLSVVPAAFSVAQKCLVLQIPEGCCCLGRYSSAGMSLQFAAAPRADEVPRAGSSVQQCCQDSIKAPRHGALLRSWCELPFSNKAHALVWLSMDPTVPSPGASQEGQCHPWEQISHEQGESKAAHRGALGSSHGQHCVQHKQPCPGGHLLPGHL